MLRDESGFCPGIRIGGKERGRWDRRVSHFASSVEEALVKPSWWVAVMLSVVVCSAVAGQQGVPIEPAEATEEGMASLPCTIDNGRVRLHIGDIESGRVFVLHRE